MYGYTLSNGVLCSRFLLAKAGKQPKVTCWAGKVLLVKLAVIMHTHAVISRLVILNSLLLCVFSVSSAPLKYDWIKVGSKVYSNVTIVGANTTDLYFTHSKGISNVKLKYLDESLRSRFNYDPKAAEAAEKEQTNDDLAYQGQLVSKINERAEKAALMAKKAASTSENSIADPISESSLLGKPAPPMEVEKWLGEKPDVKGKFALIFFWGPWSVPCRKMIPQFNALQKKFADRLVIIGLSSDTKEEIDQMSEPLPQFACALDSKARMSIAASVTSIPYVLFLDPKGVVRYQGHPSALDEKRLESLMAKPE
jgi:cytochrome c biogenesis protein CcmG, thiol:disulfide interchange protein DsbE